MGFLGGLESACQYRRCGFDPWVGTNPGRKKWQLTPVFLPWRSYGQKGLVGYSPWDCKRIGHDLATKKTKNPSYRLYFIHVQGTGWLLNTQKRHTHIRK